MNVKALEKLISLIKEKKKSGKAIAIAGVLVVVLAGSGISYRLLSVKAASDEIDRKEYTGQMPEESTRITGEGTTSMGIITQMPEFAVDIVTMQVEEVYVESGSTVKEGDALFKITEESMAELTAYYKEKIIEAENALQTAQLDYENGKLEAEYTRQETLLEAESAQTVLDTALLELEESLQEKKEAFESAQTDIATYTSNLENNSYYTNAKIDEKTTAITEAEENVKTTETDYQTAEEAYKKVETTLSDSIEKLSSESESAAWDEETITKIKVLTKEIAENYEAVSEKQKTLSEKKAAYENAGQELQNAQFALEEAKTQYTKDTEEATQKLSELEEKLPELESAYETAVIEAERTKVDLQNTYDMSVLEGTSADETYAATLASLEKTVHLAQETLQELQEAQAALTGMENGVVCATQTGTLASVAYEAEDILASETALVSYYDTSVITVSVEIAQEDIAKIAVGDSTSVIISNNRRESLEGTVSSIAPTATTGGSVSNVTYAVEIVMDNTDGLLSAGSSVTVFFSEDETEN